MAPENLHMTLAFLGHTSPDQQQAMEDWAEQLPLVQLSLTLDRLGHWPKPRVLWLGPAHWPAALDALAASLAEGMRRCGLTPDPRPYAPHVTLLRKAHAPVRRAFVPIGWETAGFVLCESVSLPEGVQYRVIRQWGNP